MIKGRLTGSSLIEIYKAENETLAIRPLAEAGLANLKNLADGEGKRVNPSTPEKWRFAETAAGLSKSSFDGRAC